MNELGISYEKKERLIARVKGLLTEYDFENTVAVLGSFHCKDECYNVSPIVTAGGLTYSVKGNSAVKQGEQIRTSDSTQFQRYRTPYGTILVWICLDMYDPSLVFKLIRWNYRLSPERSIEVSDYELDFEPVDLLLVPSYNADIPNELEDTVRLISKYARTTVIVCNDLASWARHNENGAFRNTSFCYRFGEKMTAQESTVLSGKCVVSTFELPNWDKNKERMSSAYKDFSSSLAKMLGCEAADQSGLG
jgi:hypothetical protein